MRIQPVTEANTHRQPKPYFIQKTGYVTAGKSASFVPFTECLRSQIQDIRVPAMIRNMEGQAISSIWGYYMPQQVSLKPELRNRVRAFEAQSDQ